MLEHASNVCGALLGTSQVWARRNGAGSNVWCSAWNSSSPDKMSGGGMIGSIAGSN